MTNPDFCSAPISVLDVQTQDCDQLYKLNVNVSGKTFTLLVARYGVPLSGGEIKCITGHEHLIDLGASAEIHDIVRNALKDFDQKQALISVSADS